MSLHFPNPVIDSNIGGCNSFSFIEADNVVLYATDPSSNSISKLILHAGNDFFNGYASYGSLRFEEKIKKNDSGTLFSVKITGFYPNLSEDIHGLFSSLIGKYFIVKITDNNLNTRLAGTPETPLKFTFDTSSGRSPSARSGYEFSFYGDVLRPSPLIK